eukprot:superscaffoldBa00002884_g15566
MESEWIPPVDLSVLSEELCLRLEAKPKTQACSTPEPWTLVKANINRSCPSGLISAAAPSVARSPHAAVECPLRAAIAKAGQSSCTCWSLSLALAGAWLPAVVVIGDSITHHVAVSTSKTFCFPGALVKDMTAFTLQLLEQDSSASAVVVHSHKEKLAELKNLDEQIVAKGAELRKLRLAFLIPQDRMALTVLSSAASPVLKAVFQVLSSL